MGNTLSCCECPSSLPNQDMVPILKLNPPASSFTSANLKDLCNAYHRLSSLDLDPETLTPDQNLLSKYKNISSEIDLIGMLTTSQKYFTSHAKSDFVQKSLSLTKGDYDLKDKQNSQFEVRMKESIGSNGWRQHEAYHNFDLKFHPLDYLIGTLYLEASDRKKFDSTLESHEVFFHYEEDGILYYFHRLTTKKILMMKGKELVFATAVKKMPDGSYIEVNRSYSEGLRAPCETWERMELFCSTTLFTANEDVEGAWKSQHYQLIDPRTVVSLKVLKFFMGSYYKKYYKGIFTMLEEIKEKEGESWKIKMRDVDFDKCFFQK
jgi:hypothetical protein